MYKNALNLKNYSKAERRNQTICSLVDEGVDINEIAGRFDITRQRVHQISNGRGNMSRCPGRPARKSKLGNKSADWYTRLGCNLRDARLERKVTLQSLSDTTAGRGYPTYVETTRLSRIERSQVWITAQELLSICKGLNVEVGDVWPKGDDRAGVQLVLDLDSDTAREILSSVGYGKRVIDKLLG